MLSRISSAESNVFFITDRKTSKLSTLIAKPEEPGKLVEVGHDRPRPAETGQSSQVQRAISVFVSVLLQLRISSLTKFKKLSVCCWGPRVHVPASSRLVFIAASLPLSFP
jgi:hypothetical protein